MTSEPGSENAGAAGPELPDDIRKLTFEDALKELESIVAKLEAGEVSLEDSIEMYTRGSLLKRHCENKLAAAEARIETLTLDNSGQVRRESFEA